MGDSLSVNEFMHGKRHGQDSPAASKIKGIGHLGAWLRPGRARIGLSENHAAGGKTCAADQNCHQVSKDDTHICPLNHPLNASIPMLHLKQPALYPARSGFRYSPDDPWMALRCALVWPLDKLSAYNVLQVNHQRCTSQPSDEKRAGILC